MDDVSKEYEGKVISRKSLQAFSDDEEDEAEEEEEEDEEMEDGEDEDEYAGEDAGDDELIDDEEEDEDEDEDQEDQDDDEDDDSEHEYGASSMLVDGLTDQQLKVQQQLAALEEEDEQTTSVFQPRGSAATSSSATNSSTTAASQYTKSVHMKNQLVWYKHLLNLRIRLQGVLSNANRLPPPAEEAEGLREQFEAESEEVKPAFDDAVQNASKLLEELFELQSGLMTQNEKIFAANQEDEDDSSASPIPTYQGIGKKRKHSGADADEDDDAETQPAADDIDSDEILDSYWSYLSTEVTPFFRPVQDALITKWNTKTQLSSGQLHALAGGGASNTLGRGADSKTPGLKVINQSILAQIESQMMDETRLIKRTQIHRMNAEQKLLGRVKKERETQAKKKQRTMDDDDLNDAASGLLGRTQTEDDYDTFIYDDNDYYQQLLQEIISANNAAAAADTGDSDLISSAQSARKKTRKSGAVVDRRASKGRKLRYTIHAKLANFMAPKPAPITMEYEANKSQETGGMQIGSGFAMDELFMNLFGGLGKQ